MDNITSTVPNYQPLEIPNGRPPEPIPLEPFPQTEEVDARWIYNATIEEIQIEDDVYYLTVSFQELSGTREGPIQTLILLVSEQLTRLYDQERRIILPVNLEPGMIIDAFISSRMTMSLPPQVTTFQIIVVASPYGSVITMGNIVQVNIRNNFILLAPDNDPENILRVSVTPETVLLGASGRHTKLKELYPGMHVRVEHEQFMTASIPPQTTGYLIQVIK